jgi:MFS family permease
VGGFITRLGIGGLPLLVPLLYQLGLGLPAWESGLLMMPAAAAAMAMKFISTWVLQRHGYRRVLLVNTLMIGVTISLFGQVTPATPIPLIVALGLAQGFFNSLQFSAMNSMAYADVESADTSMAATIASSLQQLSLSFGLACGSLITAWYLGNQPQTDHSAVSDALHHTFVTLGVVTVLSSLLFRTLRANDGDSVSRGDLREGN